MKVRIPAIGLLWVVVSASGCAPSIHWRGAVYEPVFAEARRDEKLTLAYLRSWFMIECTAFEETVLADPAVVEATRPMYCVMLDFRWAESLAAIWGIKRPPAIVIVDPQGRVRGRLSGEITREAMIRELRQAQEAFAAEAAATTQPG